MRRGARHLEVRRRAHVLLLRLAQLTLQLPLVVPHRSLRLIPERGRRRGRVALRAPHGRELFSDAGGLLAQRSLELAHAALHGLHCRADARLRLVRRLAARLEAAEPHVGAWGRGGVGGGRYGCVGTRYGCVSTRVVWVLVRERVSEWACE